MTFQISIGFSGLDNPDGQDEQSKTYALFIGDTVVVNEVNKSLLIMFFFSRKYFRMNLVQFIHHQKKILVILQLF
jgi:nucleosome binding factor SPN SPT16 subunit